MTHINTALMVDDIEESLGGKPITCPLCSGTEMIPIEKPVMLRTTLFASADSEILELVYFICSDCSHAVQFLFLDRWVPGAVVEESPKDEMKEAVRDGVEEAMLKVVDTFEKEEPEPLESLLTEIQEDKGPVPKPKRPPKVVPRSPADSENIAREQIEEARRRAQDDEALGEHLFEDDEED